MFHGFKSNQILPMQKTDNSDLFMIDEENQVQRSGNELFQSLNSRSSLHPIKEEINQPIKLQPRRSIHNPVSGLTQRGLLDDSTVGEDGGQNMEEDNEQQTLATEMQDVQGFISPLGKKKIGGAIKAGTPVHELSLMSQLSSYPINPERISPYTEDVK